MPKHLRPISHEDRLSVVDHLDELRSRLIVCVSVLAVAFGICFWQSSHLLNVLNSPLTHLNKSARDELGGTTNNEVAERKGLLGASVDLQLLATQTDLSNSDSAIIAAAANQLTQAAKALPKKTNGVTPVALGVGEPFTTSVKVAFYFAVLFTLPLLLYEIFAFVVPALEGREKRVVVPLLITAPALFFSGVVFTYLVILPAAIKFLQGYNASHFQALVQASAVYSFEVLTMGGVGLAFEMPLILLGARAIGVINGRTLTTHWRYAILVIAIIAAALPGADPVTTALETAPLVILYVVSIILLRFFDRKAARQEAADLASGLTDL
jgi:sec-independent protein translocase protein TatC